MASLESQLKAYAGGTGNFKSSKGNLNWKLTELAQKAGYTQDYFDQLESERKSKAVSKSQDTGKQRSNISKAFDQVNFLDSGRSWSTDKPSAEQAKKGVLTQLSEGVGSTYTRVGEAVGETVNQFKNGDKQQRNFQEGQGVLQGVIDRATERLKDTNLPADKRKQFEKLRAETVKSRDKLYGQRSQRLDEVIERTDPVKGAAAIGSIGFDIATAGTVSGAAQAGTRTAGRQIAGRVLSGASQGAVSGGLSAVEQQGKDTSLMDIAKGAGVGALVGGGLVGGVEAVGGTVRAANKIKPSTIAETRVGAKVANTQVAKKIGQMKDQVVAKIVDDTNFIKKPFKGITNKQTGRKVTDEIEELVTNVRQFDGLSQSRLDNNTAFQQLKTEIAGNKKAYRENADFISRKQDAINNNKLIESGQRKGVLMEVPTGNAQQERAYELLNQSTKNDVQYLFDNGIIDEPKYQQWMQDPDYTRVQREVGDELSGSGFGGGRLVSGSPVTGQKLKGSTKKAVDPFAAYEDWQRRVTLDVERNKLSKYIRDQSLENNITNQVDVSTKGYERLKELYGEEGLKKETLPVFEKGIKELYTIDPRAAQQIANSSKLELGAIADWALLPSRLLKGGATTLNVAFAVPNFVRDQLSSGIISKNIRATHNPIAFWHGLKEAVLKPTGNATIRKIPGITGDVFQPSKEFSEFLSRNQNMTSVDLARNLKSATRRAQEDLGVKGQSVIRRFEDVISASEKQTRYQNFIGTYRNAIKKKVDPEQALKLANEAARSNSVNFSNRGEIATFMKIFNPYFNAGVQGSRTLAKAFKERPVGTSMKIASTIMLPTAAAVYYNMSDPERAEIYANIPERTRRDNIIMVLGGGRNYIKVPMPPGMREFAGPLRNYIESEYLGDRQGFLETAKNLLIDPFSPVGTTKNELMTQAIPQAVRPVVEVGMNKDVYFGRDVVPERMQGLPKAEQTFSNTPDIYNKIGKALNVSPLQVRKIVTGYGAGGLEGALATADLPGGKSAGRSTVEQVVSRFYGTQAEDGGAVTSKFYDTYTPLKQKKEAFSGKITKAVKANDMKEANRIANEVNAEIEKERTRLKEEYGKFETDLTPLFERLDSLKFPMQGSRLSNASVKARKK